ncbi:MAG TPA: hypothetical protein VD862_03590 [Candidatus Paceibacterota bacterium]|nr:hypothetical protein [Candidatus Paceibacterota bacterium]
MTFPDALWWYLLLIAVAPVLLFGLAILIALVIYVRDSMRLHGLMKDLEMDRVAIAQRAADKDVSGLMNDIAAKLRERVELLCYPTERIAQELLREESPESVADATGTLVRIHQLREVLARTNPEDVWYLDVSPERLLSPSARERFSGVAGDWLRLKRMCGIYRNYMRRYGAAISAAEAKRRGTP